MTETPETTAKRGKPKMPEIAKKRKVEIYVSPAVADLLEARDIQNETERKAEMLKRKRRAADILKSALTPSAP